MLIKKPLLFILFLLPLQVSFADEFELGMLFLCDADQGLFSLTSIAEINVNRIGNDAIYTAIPLRGHGRVTFPSDLKCTIENTLITANYYMIPPRPTGECGGLTHIMLTSLQVDGEEFIEENLNFNDSCAALSVVDIEVRLINDEIFTKICYSDIEDILTYTISQCDTSSQKRRTVLGN